MSLTKLSRAEVNEEALHNLWNGTVAWGHREHGVESRSGVLFEEIKENRNSKDSTHFSAIVSVVAWSHGVELQWGEILE